MNTGNERPPLEQVITWLEHRLQGTLVGSTERMYKAELGYLKELKEMIDKYGPDIPV